MMKSVTNESCVSFLEKIYNQTKDGMLQWEDVFNKHNQRIVEWNVHAGTKELANEIMDFVGQNIGNSKKNRVRKKIVLSKAVIIHDKILSSFQCQLSKNRHLHLFYTYKTKQCGISEYAWRLYDEQNEQLSFICEAVMDNNDDSIFNICNNIEPISQISYDITSLYGADPVFNLLNRLAEAAEDSARNNISLREVHKINLVNILYHSETKND